MTRIYLDNAASTPVLQEVNDAMYEATAKYYGNPSSIHIMGREAKSIIEECRKKVADLFNCSIGEIFFTSGATESNNTVLYSLVLNKKIDHIITSPIEHPCVLNTLQYLSERSTLQTHFLNVDPKGRISPRELEDKLSQLKGQKAVSLMYANNEIGIVNPVQQISDLCIDHGALFHSDAVQAIGHFPIDLQEWKVDYLSASAHKFHGPKGIGLLYMSGESIFPSLIKGGSQERNMRAGTENVSSIVGLTKALELSYQHLSEWRSHILSLRSIMMEELLNWNSELEFFGEPNEEDLYTVLSVKFPDHPKSELLTMLLDIEGIAVSGGSACSSGTEKTSHVVKALAHEDQRSGIRFSFSHLNTKEEILETINKIKKIYE